MQINKKRIFIFLALLTFFLMRMISTSFAQLSESQLSQAISSAANRTEIAGSLLNSVIVDVESGMDITFVDQEESEYTVRVSDFFDPTVRYLGGQNKKQAAIVRITGAPFEAMVDIEELTLDGFNQRDEKVFSLSKFNIMSDGAGASVTVLPFDNDISYVLAIGGSVKDVKNLESIYEGFNVININYL